MRTEQAMKQMQQMGDERPATRRLMHTRQMVCRGYERDDGLWDIEGELSDIKTHDVRATLRDVAAGEPIHRMVLTLTIDTELVIRKVAARTDAAPTADCHDIPRSYAALEGLKIGPGFTARVRQKLGGIRGCTHLTELIGALATASIQALWPVLARREAQRLLEDPGAAPVRPWVIDTCHAYRSDGEAVMRVFPAHYTGAVRPGVSTEPQAPDERQP